MKIRSCLDPIPYGREEGRCVYDDYGPERLGVVGRREFRRFGKVAFEGPH